MSHSRLLIVAPIVAAIALSLASPAFARLDEMIVTAQKRAEDIQDVPISITAFSGDFLDASGIDSLQGLAEYVPNLSLHQSSQVANNRMIMRGVGSVGNNAIEPSVAVFIDGIYYPRPGSVVGALSDIEAVEVLRGPQGTLFGRNASMGALNIRTAAPSDEFEGRIRASYGAFNRLRATAALSGPVAADLSGRLALQYSERDGYGDNTYTAGGSRAEVGDWRDFNLRGKLRYTPADSLQIDLSVDYSGIDNEGSVIEVKSDTVLPAYLGTISAALSPTLDALFAALNPMSNTAPLGPVPETGDGRDYDLHQDHRDFADDRQWGASMEVRYDVGEHTLRSITGYRRWENTTFESALRLPAALFDRDTYYETSSLSQEVQLLSPGGRALEYTAGFYYYDEDYDIDQNFDLGADFCRVAGNLTALQMLNAGTPSAMAMASATGLSRLCDAGPQDNGVDGFFQQEVDSIATYLHLSWRTAYGLRLSGGLRYTWDDKTGAFSQQVTNPVVASLRLRITEEAPDLAFDDSKLTYLLNLSWEATDNLLAFVSRSTGYKSGGFNSDGGNRELERVFATEEVENWEVGLNSTLLADTLTANLTFFHTTIDDFQNRRFDGVNLEVHNVGQLTQQGLEADLQYAPNANFHSLLGISYLHSNFDSFPTATNLPAVVAGAQMQGVLPPPLDISGQRNHFSPKWQLSAIGEYRGEPGRLLPANMNWFARGEIQYTSARNVGGETNQNPQGMQKGYHLLNGRFGLRAADLSWEVSAFVNNATDEAYCQVIFNQPVGTTIGLVDANTGGGMQRCVLGMPRTFGVEAAYNF